MHEIYYDKDRLLVFKVYAIIHLADSNIFLLTHVLAQALVNSQSVLYDIGA